MFDWLKKKPTTETRASGTGYTAQVMAARASYIAGMSGLGELTGTVQSCVSLWEGALGLADVEGTDLLTRHALGIAARSLALRGEAVFLIDDAGLIPASDWDLSTRNSRPYAYRLTLPEIGGGTTRNALAAEVLHFTVAADATVPYGGQAPLRRSSLTAGMLQAVEQSFAETFATAPVGSQVLPFPQTPEQDLETIATGFRGNRGKVLLRESVQVQAAGGVAPQLDWKPHDLTPDLQKVMAPEMIDRARASILAAFGVLPALNNQNATGPAVREAQRHLAQWTLQPIAAGMAEEATAKLGGPVSLDVMRPMQAFDAGGRARAAAQIVQMLALAKEAGVDPALALKAVDWD